VHLPLIKLSLRRSLLPTLLLGGAVVAWALWSTQGRELVRGAVTPGLLRYSVWMAGVCVAGPLLIMGAAQTGHRLAREDAAWTASRPASRLSILLSSWAGYCLAACIWLLLVAAAAELSAGEQEERSLQPLGSVALTPLEDDRGYVASWQLEANSIARDLVLRIPVGLIGVDGPSARVLVRLTRSESGALTEREQQLATTRPIEIELPEGDGPLTLQLERVGEGAIVLVPSKQAELWKITEEPAVASLLLSYQGILLACAMIAWAMSLGVWLRPAAAAGLVLSISFGLWVSEGPLGGWGALMENLSNGDVPGPPTLSGAFTSLAAWATGTLMGWWGLRKGGRG